MAVIKPNTIAPMFLVGEIFSSPDDDCILCLLSSREVTILREALFPVSSWRTRLGEWQGRFFNYTQDDEVIENFRDLVDTIDYKLSGGQMTTCFDSVKEGLEAIAAAIAKLECLCGGGSECPPINYTPGGEQIPADVDPEAGPGENEGEGTPPDGYASWEDYYNGKCAAAYFIVSGVISCLTSFAQNSALMGAALCAAILLSVLTLQLPVAVIAALVAALTFIEAGVLADVAAMLEDNIDELKCALYNSKTVGAAIDACMEIINEGLGTLSLSIPVTASVKLILSTLLSESAAQILFTVVGATLPAADCSDCVESECPGVMVVGTGNPEIDGTLTGAEESQGGGHTYYRINVNYKYGLEWCTKPIRFSNFDNFGYNLGNLPNALTIYGADDTEILYQSWNTPPDPETTYNTCAIDFWSQDSVPTVDIDIQD